MQKIKLDHLILKVFLIILGMTGMSTTVFAQSCPGTESRVIVCRDYLGNEVADTYCYRIGTRPLTTRACPADCPSDNDNSDPLIFDLDGNGISLLSPSDGIMFDVDNDGVPDASGWVKSGDGLLALDKNHNGTIDDQSELFGSQENGAFADLAQFDKGSMRWGGRHDGVIDWKDPIYRHLRMWVDKNENGITDKGELKTLYDDHDKWNRWKKHKDDLHITEISLKYDTLDEINNGNKVTGVGTFTRIKKNGKKVVSKVMEALFGFKSGD